MLLTATLLVLAQAEPAKVAVLELKSTGVDEVVTKNLSELFTAEAGKVPGFKVIGNQEIQDIVGFEIQRQTLGCADASCFSELSGALGVDLIVSGSIGAVGDTFVISLKLINPKKNETQARVGETLVGRVELLTDYVRVAAWRLMGQPVPGDVQAKFEATQARLKAEADAAEQEKADAKAERLAASKAAAQKVPQPLAPVKKPWTWQRVGRNASGLMIVGGLLYGGASMIGALRAEEGEELPGFSGDPDDLRKRGYIVGGGLLGAGILGMIVFSALEPEPGSVASYLRVGPTGLGVAF